MKSIYAVHQGFELYGSDRVFIRTLGALRAEWPEATITASIPAEGPLAETLRADGFDVAIDDLWVLRRSLGLKLPLRLLKLPLAMYRAWTRGRDADLVYISTTVILDHMLVAPFWSGGVIVHAHELPTGMAATVLSGLLRWSRAAVVFISKATEDAYVLGQETVSKIIHNGHEEPQRNTERTIRADNPLRVLMIGRINDWKGQDLLVEAVALLPNAARGRVRVRVVGDTFGGAASKAALVALIAAKGLDEEVTVEGFLDDPSPAYEWCDIVAAPSRNPEPFGLIAIEAMSWSRPVIAAKHGGLVEIVEDGTTGRLFAPNDPAALAQALRAYVSDAASVAAHGAAGRSRYEQSFTSEAYARSFVAFARAVIERKTDGSN
ncbi:MAG: glycosyltransferase family 4 protein [Brevundimonas sp.]|uniref:glycosyltransferase family 4 protein n=1 Tax=Brevundimonas sp. TaxID=1871086 RepID=UPI0027355B7D|nr:glycosyltransferase family 4 protein [Brevundimonas sp.]MDP3405212.1 glycosyltransferase family 4 protein [Brevundimonas sp.]